MDEEPPEYSRGPRNFEDEEPAEEAFGSRSGMPDGPEERAGPDGDDELPFE